MNPTNTHLNDAALERLAREVDLLAQSDSARDGLEARVFGATLPLLQQQPTLRLVGETTRVTVTRRRSLWSATPMRIAAGFALVATAALTYIAARPAPAPLDNNVRVIAASSNPGEEWAIVSSLFDDGTRAELDDIFAATSSLQSSINSMGLSDLLDDEGAM
jgi:hypothetical protein